MIPTPSELTAFIEVFKTRHVSKAALRLGVSQPSLSQALLKLEEKVGARLFHRTKQGVIPTREGTLFFRNTSSLLENWGKVSAQLSDSLKKLEGRFLVGCHLSVAAYTLPDLFRNLRDSAPRIEIELVHDYSRKITDALISYEIDLAYVTDPMKHPDLILKKLGVDRVKFWRASNNPSPPKMLFSDLTQAQYEKFVRKTKHRGLLDGFKLICVASLELIRSLVLKGEGVGLLPERVALADKAALTALPMHLPDEDDEIYLAYRPDLLSTHAGKALAKAASISLPNLA